jgi:hypothetical protein
MAGLTVVGLCVLGQVGNFERAPGRLAREADVKARKATMMLAAAGLAITPVASNAAASLSIARAAPQLSHASAFADEDHHNRTAEAVLGGLLLVLLVAAAAIGASGKSVSP